MMAGGGQSPSGGRLPELRQDLSILERQSAGETGQEAHWLVYDPIRHRYIEVDRTAIDILATWRAGTTVAQLVKQIAERTGKQVSNEDVAAFVNFAEREYLVADTETGNWRELARIAIAARAHPLRSLVHNYLYFKIPLVAPQAFLERTAFIAVALTSRAAIGILVTLGVAGLYLVSREFDAFIATFKSFLSFEGILAFAASLVFVKLLHELGHAYTAVRYGCRVPSMGVAFMVLTPMLYTDVSDAWRLGSRRQRLAIDSAGVVVELAIAALATFLWPFLPPGTLKGVVFVLATTSWIMSVAINLNPFMRFDGYYILSDAWGVANLQERSFALARWRLREMLFGLGEPPPEIVEARRRRWLIVYAVATWVYRLALFIGIALLVYHYFFKVLGVVLFIVEIAYFVARPFWGEMMEWKKRLPAIAVRRRSYASVGVLSVMVVLAVVPWSGRVDVPAIIEPIVMAQVYPPSAAEIVAINIRPGAKVERGEVIGVLRSWSIERELTLVDTKVHAARARLARVVADRADREQVGVIDRELKALLAERDGLVERKAELVLKAPVTGEVVELAPALHPGRVIGKQELVAVIADRDRVQARGYVGESDVGRISVGNSGRFVYDDGRIAALEMRVAAVGQSGVAALELGELSSTFDGPVAAVETRERRLVPVAAHFPVRLQVETSDELPKYRVRGIAVIDGSRESFAVRLWRQILRIAVREGSI